jgi:hypothetical protein
VPNELSADTASLTGGIHRQQAKVSPPVAPDFCVDGRDRDAVRVSGEEELPHSVPGELSHDVGRDTVALDEILLDGKRLVHEPGDDLRGFPIAAD